MKLGYIGLGKMGSNMVARLRSKGHEIITFDPHIAGDVSSLQDLVLRLEAPRVIWLMVPHSAVEDVIKGLVPQLSKGDAIIDGGNSPYMDSMRRARELAERGIDFLDAGVSGGPEGARTGACIMVGGNEDVYKRCEVLFQDAASEEAYLYVGASGSGHFAKMIHNGIEYGMMQALAEGFTILKASDFDIDLARMADLYNHKSVIESRLVGWLKSAFEKHGKELDNISSTVAHTGEGKWTVEAGEKLGVPTLIITASQQFREDSVTHPSYTARILSALRGEFGGHDVAQK